MGYAAGHAQLPARRRSRAAGPRPALGLGRGPALPAVGTISCVRRDESAVRSASETVFLAVAPPKQARSAADGGHRPGGLQEAWVVDAMPGQFGGDGPAPDGG